MNLKYIFFFLLVFPGAACKKYLDLKPDKSRFLVSKPTELQGLLDYEMTYTDFPVAGLLAGDDGYFLSSDFNSLPFTVDKNTHIWDPQTDLTREWAVCYEKVFKMNVILEELKKMTEVKNLDYLKQIEGSARFLRALCHLEVAQLFAPHYRYTDSDSPFGVPIKLVPDTEEFTIRASLKETYEAIVGDLKSSLTLLPDTASVKTRPSKVAAYGLLARIYLQTGNFEMAEKYADSSLSIYNRIIDFNDGNLLAINSSVTFPIFNPEVLFHASCRSAPFLPNLNADSVLIQSYDKNDLRLPAFFTAINNGTYRFKGGYTGPRSDLPFCGMSTNEILLIRAEAQARNNKVQKAVDDLNSLLIKRWKTNTYITKVITDQKLAIDTILLERRKELCFRPSLRWADIKRLNQETRYAKVLTRHLNNLLSQLKPNDDRYAFLIPQSVVILNKLIQNPR